MSQKAYTKIQRFLPEIKAMVSLGSSQREIAEHFGLRDKYIVKELLKRERRSAGKVSAGIPPKAKGRPRKDGLPPHQNEKSELEQLRMENKLLRDFLQFTGRK